MSAEAAFEALAARIAAASPATAELREVARQALFDTLFAALIGRRLSDAAPLAAMPLEGHGRLRVLVATIRATEIDDIAIGGCVTAGSVVVPTALHVAAREGAGASAVHDAMIAGYEVMIAFAEAIGGATAIYQGVWPTLTAAPMGAAAVAARLHGLDVDRTRAAMALAAGRASGRINRSLPRWLSLGQAAADGVLAAEAALAGFEAPASTVDAWSALTGVPVAPERLAAAERPRLLDVDVKPFPTARQALSTIEAFRLLVADKPIDEGDRVVIGVPAAYRDMTGKTTAPEARLASVISAAYQLALIAHAPGAIDDAVRDPPLASAAIAAFLQQVTVETDPALDAAFPSAWGGRVRIEPKDGGPAREMTVLDPHGSAKRPFGWADLEEKATRLGRANGLDLGLVSALRDAVKSDAPAQTLLDLVTR